MFLKSLLRRRVYFKVVKTPPDVSQLLISTFINGIVSMTEVADDDLELVYYRPDGFPDLQLLLSDSFARPRGIYVHFVRRELQ